MSAAYAIDPFGPSPDPGAYVAVEASERARAALERALDAGRVAAVVGPPGHGKTLLLRLVGGREEARARVAYVPFCTLEADDLFALVLNLLGVRRQDAPRDALLRLARELASRGGLVILVDDASAMSDACASGLAALVGEAQGTIRLCLAAVEGQDALRVLRAFGSDVDVVHLAESLSEGDVRRYVEARLAYGRVNPALLAAFDDDTIGELHRASQGVPRQLNHAAERVVRRADPDPLPRLSDIAAVPTSPAPPAPADRPLPAPPLRTDLPQSMRRPAPPQSASLDRSRPAPPPASLDRSRPAPPPASLDRSRPAPPPASLDRSRPAPPPPASPERPRPAAAPPLELSRFQSTVAPDRAPAPARAPAEPAPRTVYPPPAPEAPRRSGASEATPAASAPPGLPELEFDDEDLGIQLPQLEVDEPRTAAPVLEVGDERDVPPSREPPERPATPPPPQARPGRGTPPPSEAREEPGAVPPLETGDRRALPPLEPIDDRGILLPQPPPGSAPPEPARATGPSFHAVRGSTVLARSGGATQSESRPADRTPRETRERAPSRSSRPKRGVRPPVRLIGIAGFALGVAAVLMLNTEGERPVFAPGPSVSFPSPSAAPDAPAPAESAEPVEPPPSGVAARAEPDPAPTSPAPPAPAVAPTPTPAAERRPLPPRAAALAPTHVAVSINAIPWAIVEVDGRELGETPLAGVRLTPGLHRFRAHMPDGTTREREIEIRPGQATVVFD